MRKRAKASSRYKGVSWHTERFKWKAAIKVNKKQISLGRFASEEEAARAYDRAARQHFGEFARLNFPQEVGS